MKEILVYTKPGDGPSQEGQIHRAGDCGVGLLSGAGTLQHPPTDWAGIEDRRWRLQVTYHRPLSAESYTLHTVGTRFKLFK